jgi:perosamine synthetase
MPVVVDSDPVTWNMDVRQIEAKITPRTKAIMVVHIYGLPVDMGPVLALAQKHGLYVIEDAAEMHGQTWKGQPCGSFGHISTFSFYANKHLTTGEGGMLVTNDGGLAERCRSFRNLCFIPERRFVHEELGWNYRMTSMQAALGLAQLERLNDFVRKKRRMGAFYEELLSGTLGLVLPPKRSKDAESIYWVYGLMVDDSLPFDATNVTKKLHEHGIGTRPFFWPIHEQPVFLNRGWFRGERHPEAEKMARRGFYLPSGLGLTEDQQLVVAKAVRCVMSELIAT